MSVTPVYGNQGFTHVTDTIVTPQRVNVALDDASVAPFKVAVGTLTPTAVATYAVLDSNNANLVLPVGALVTNVMLVAPTTLTSGGAPTFQPFLGLTSTASTTALTATSTLAQVNTGISPAVTLAVPVTAAAQYLSLGVAVAAPTAGVVKVIVVYVDTVAA